MKAITLLSVCRLTVDDAIVSAWGNAAAQEAPKVAIPKPGVPEIVTIEDTFVRANLEHGTGTWNQLIAPINFSSWVV